MKFSTHPLSPDLASRRDLQVAPIDLELAARLRTSLAFMLTEDGALVNLVYDELFARFPELRGYFKNDLTAVKKKMIDTLEWIINNLNQPADVRAAARTLGKKHEGFGVRPEHYPIFRDLMVRAMAKVSGDKWTRELEADWTLSFDLLAALMTGQTFVRRGDRTASRV